MPATLPNLYISARRLRRKQHIWMTDTGGGDTLLKIVPYRGTKMVAFSFWCKGVTEVRKQGRVVVPPQPHKQIIAFTDCNILPEGEKPDEKDRSNYFVVSYNGDDYWVEKINLNKQKAVVRCDCKDFIFSWAYSDFKNGCLWGPPPKKYIRKTPPPPKGRPYRNACFIGSTKIKLLDGTVKSFEELYNSQERFWVYSCDEAGKFHPGNSSTVFKTGEVTHLVKVTLDNGDYEVCTPEHLWMLRDGSYKQAQDLQPFDSLMPLYTNCGEINKPFYGYERILENDSNKWRFTHRLVTEDIYGLGYHDYSNVVHHYDINFKNNNPDNLIPMTKQEHTDIHRKIMSEFRWTSEKRALQKEKTKKLWENEEYRKSMSNMMLELWKNPEHKKLVSESSKNVWKDPSYRNTITAKIREHHSNIEYKHKMSEKAKDMWNTKRDIIVDSIKNSWTEDRKKRMSEISSKNIETGKCPSIVDYYGGYESFKLAMQERAKQPGFSDYISENMKSKWADPNSKLRKDASNRNSRNVAAKWSNVENKIKHQKAIIERITKDILKQGYNINSENWDSIIKDYSVKNNIAMRDLRKKNTILKYYSSIEDLLDIVKVNHKVAMVEHIYTDKPVPVYDITVENYHNFALASGVYVHNSGYPGYCKHVFYIYKNFMLNKQQYSWAGTSQAVSGATYFHQ